MISREAFRFFRANAGGWVGHNAETALHLARAEAYAEDQGWEVSWEPDDYGWEDHDDWCPVAALAKRGRLPNGEESQSAWHLRQHACEHEIACAVLRDRPEIQTTYRGGRAGEVLASLGAIIDASDAYKRVVAAELASEALAEIKQRERNDREAPSYLAL